MLFWQSYFRMPFSILNEVQARYLVAKHVVACYKARGENLQP